MTRAILALACLLLALALAVVTPPGNVGLSALLGAGLVVGFAAGMLA